MASSVLGPYPKGAEIETLYFSLYHKSLYDDFEAVPSGDVYHMVYRQHGSMSAALQWLRDEYRMNPVQDYVYGSTTEARNTVADITELIKSMPVVNDVKRGASGYVNALRSELPGRPRMPHLPIPRVNRPAHGDGEVKTSREVLRKMNTVSALEAAKVILTGMDSLGNSEERLATVMEVFPKGIPTAVPPSSPAYSRLLSMLGPLSYQPSIEGHPAAGTIRRAAMNHAIRTLEGAIVGLVSPSNAEVHAFPMAAIWQYTDKTDLSRNHAHCSRCKAPRCFIRDDAKKAGRYFSGQDQHRAAALFKKFQVSALLLINIEPNINASDLTRLMVKSGAYTALSLVTVDWRVLLGRTVVDPLIGMTTEQSYGKIVSSFHDSGDYVQSQANVKQLFAPTFASGHSMRRTIIFGDGASQYFQITLTQGGWATRCVPQHEKYYFIRLILPDLTRPVVLVEREGFDRVLATYRTQAVKGKDVARITLRQSVVTYSISGTQVTPRLRLTATEAEALSVWIEVYSEVQDALALKHAEEMRPSTVTTDVKSAIFRTVTDTLSRTKPGAMALGSYSSVEALLRAYRTSVGENTIEQLSAAAMEEHFGVKVEPMSLQNMVVSAWGSLFSWVRSPSKWMDILESSFRSAWRVAFTYTDAINTTILLCGQFSIASMRVSVDCLQVACRILGQVDALAHVNAFIDRLDWESTKVNRFWVTCQTAQNLDFQAAVIDIVETFFNVFSADHALTIQSVREHNMLPEDQIRELELVASMPYSDFLSEVKLFLGKFNCTARKCSMAALLLSSFSHDCREADEGQRSKMIHLLKREIEEVEHDVKRQVMEFALGGKPETRPLPLRPINHQDVREAFKIGLLELNTPDGITRLRKLQKVGGHYDFSPIHALMDTQHGQVVGPDIKGPNYISPDDRGARLQEQLIHAAAERGLGARFVAPAAMPDWYARQRALPDQLDFVSQVLERRQELFTGQQASNWLAHVTGLAMGGKSKGLRSWISQLDVVVVPTRQLKEEWQENLGKLDPVRRATVVTQHEALDVKFASRYVFIDECYAFDPEHLQAIANRHFRSKGVVTIGDRRQIANVFTQTGTRLLLAECPCVMITPTTFVGWDAAAVYLDTTVTDTYVDNLFCGSDDAESLRYTLNSDDTLLPGEGDKAIQGTQVAKEMMAQRGVTCNTVHECQGSRTENTIVHGLGVCLTGDLRWLGMPDQTSHAGVLITRARQKTVFVVEGLEKMNAFRWFDEQAVNGPLPKTVVYGGTAWDLVEPRAESESTWEHLHEPRLEEAGLIETPLTDPITIATVFDAQGEPLSTSEIRTNVELVSGVVYSDLGVANSDKFDNYTAQPRDVPGADQVQALTRSVPDVKPTLEDYRNAEHIVELIFDEVLDKKLFFSHLANSKRAALKRQTRQQVIDGCYANVETAASTLSFAFLKPEFAKKPSVMCDGPSELKAQGVVSASDMQQALFADACDSLTHAWARAMRKGKLSPVGFREEEVEDFLGTFASSFELDIEKQDSSHKPVHVLVAGIFLEMASDKLGLAKVAEEIRFERRVRMMGSPFKFILNKALASGDPWTLIINKIMAVSSLISVAKLLDVRMCQSGDDVTLDREPEWRFNSLSDQHMANKGLIWKKEEREQRKEGVTFISRAVLANRTVVYKALRTILKYMSTPRNSIQHAGINADSKRIDRLAARHGLQAYAEARCQVWGGDPVVVFDMWTRALAVARTPFAELPEELKKDEPRQYTIRERNGGCFGFALANCVSDNVMAINAIAKYRGPVTMSEALQACRDNKVSCLLMNEKFANRSKKRLQDAMDRRHFSRAFVVVYEDHAVAVVPNTLTIHSGFGKRQITWKSSMSKDVEITDFE